LEQQLEAAECKLVDCGIVCDGNHVHEPCEDPECWLNERR
jgi:hypothetical protein